jgi:hypothetical protein
MAAYQYTTSQNIFRSNTIHRPSLQHATPTRSSASGTAATPSGSTLAQPAFKPPAHKHAHHLHSIPPREKSTRTLIIDHMLWVHGTLLPYLAFGCLNSIAARTRFAQARAELGMTDRTGGPSSPNYAHRRRPENYEEEDELGSEGEDTGVLKARSGARNDEEDERLRRQDLALARSLRLRAEGLEKVVTSMLEQPPPIHPINDDVITTPPSSPKLKPSKHPHTLPNGVRLRLALGTIINDLFARQAPHPAYRHTHPSPPKTEHTPPTPIPASFSDLPEALIPLATVSGAFSPQLPQPQPIAPYRYTPPRTYPQQFSSSSSPSSSHDTLPIPSKRTRSLYTAGIDHQTVNSPPTFRCPRHLHTGCEICVEAKLPTRHRSSGSDPSRGQLSSSFSSSSHGQASSSLTASSSFRAGSSSSLPTAAGTSWQTTSGTNWKITSGGEITGWKDDGSGIGSGLLRPGVRGSALRRKASGIDSGKQKQKERDGNSEERQEEGGTGSGNTKLSKLIPRFIRLSALAAAELGREVRGEEEDVGVREEDKHSAGLSQGVEAASGVEGSTNQRKNDSSGWESGSAFSPVLRPTSPLTHLRPTTPLAPRSTAQPPSPQKMYETALRPSLEWYLLLAGLLTRAVLEGYLSAGWRGWQAVQCLLLVGLGINEGAGEDQDGGESEEDEDAEFSEFDPDELPGLVDAIKILFPSLRHSSTRKGKAEEEYELEMLDRLRRVS